jgi:hypothetical protein
MPLRHSFLPETLEKLKAYQSKTSSYEKHIIDNLLRKFQELSDSLPHQEAGELRKAIGSTSTEHKHQEIKQAAELENKKVGEIRRTLTHIMESEAKQLEQKQGPTSSFYSTKNFCDIIFSIQLALAHRFPANEKVNYHLKLIPLDKKIEASDFSENFIALQKEVGHIYALVPSPTKPTGESKESIELKETKSTPSFKKIQLFLPNEQLEMLVFPHPGETYRSINLADGTRRLINSIRLQCGYPPPIENQFEEMVGLTTFTLDDPDIVITSTGHLYLRSSLRKHFKSDYALKNSKLCFPDSTPVSLREQASLLAQGIYHFRPIPANLPGAVVAAEEEEEEEEEEENGYDNPAFYHQANTTFLRDFDLQTPLDIWIMSLLGVLAILLYYFINAQPVLLPFGNTLLYTSFICTLIDQVRNYRSDESFFENGVTFVGKQIKLCGNVLILAMFSVFVFSHLLPFLTIHSLISSPLIAMFKQTLSWAPEAACLLQLGLVLYKKSISTYLENIVEGIIFGHAYLTRGVCIGAVKTAQAIKRLFSAENAPAVIAENVPPVPAVIAPAAPLQNTFNTQVQNLHLTTLRRRHSMTELKEKSLPAPTSTLSANSSFASSPFTLHSSHPSRQRRHSEPNLPSITQQPASRR